MLRFLGVSLGVAQILAMALTLMLLWALYYGHKSPVPDSVIVAPDDPAAAVMQGPPAASLKSCCGHTPKGCANMSAQSGHQVEMERLS